MKHLLSNHSREIYLKPGGVVVANQAVLVRTILGSCVAVTMFSPSRRIGAICHAMLPDSNGKQRCLRYVDTAIHYLYRKVKEFGAAEDLEIKLFGGAQVLLTNERKFIGDMTIGMMNVARAQEILAQLGLTVVKTNIGGSRGRKLFFSIQNGDVYVSLLGRDDPNVLELPA